MEEEKPAAAEEAQTEPEKSAEDAPADSAAAAGEENSAEAVVVAAESAEAENNPPVEKAEETDKAPEDPPAAAEAVAASDDPSPEDKAVEDDKVPEDPPAADAVAVSDDPSPEDKAADDGNAAVETPAEVADAAKDQPVPAETAPEEAPAETKADPPAEEQVKEEPPAPPANEPVVVEKPADLTPAGEGDKSADAKNVEEEESKDTLGPIPGKERKTRTGENLHTTPDTPDFAQDLGESVSRSDEDAGWREESTALTGGGSPAESGAGQVVTGVGGHVLEDGSGPAVPLDPVLGGAAGGIDSFDTPVEEARDASRDSRNDENEIPPVDQSGERSADGAPRPFALEGCTPSKDSEGDERNGEEAVETENKAQEDSTVTASLPQGSETLEVNKEEDAVLDERANLGPALSRNAETATDVAKEEAKQGDQLVEPQAVTSGKLEILAPFTKGSRTNQE